jgi:uncharacterized membrane protein YjgN (DUF898 family)
MERRRGNAVLAVPARISGDGVSAEESGLAGGKDGAASRPGAPGGALQRYPVRFTASGEEYFRIWIVNLALSIVTLGIYSAWAKVRKKRYFYGHTLIDGEGFEYRGNPVAILKGRLIAFVLLGLYSLAGQFAPWLQVLIMAVLAVAVPWLAVRSLAFNALNSAYRNVQFHFRGTYAEALRVLAGNGLLMLLSLGLLYPWWKARLVRFVAERHCYGDTRFALPALTGHFYRVYFKAAALVFGVFALGLIALVAGAASVGSNGLTGFTLGTAVFVLALYGSYLLAFASIRARITNLTWNHATLGQVRFECRLETGRLAFIYFVNIIAIVCTLGLAIPWAVVRTQRYRCGHMTVIAEHGLDRFLAAESAQVDATGEAVGELFNIDIGL